MTFKKPLVHALRNTMRYAAVFGAALNMEQLRSRLQGNTLVNVEELRQAVDSLSNICRQGDWVWLEEHGELIQQPRVEIWQKKLNEARKAGMWFGKIPWVRGVWVTGSVAAENAEVADDIDFLLVTSVHRLWITRFFLVAALKMIGKYQSKNKNAELRKGLVLNREKKNGNDKGLRDKWCLNLWLDESALAVPHGKRSLYTAHEVLLAKPVFLRDPGVEQRFLQENRWISDYFAHVSIPLTASRDQKLRRTFFFGDVMNDALFTLQKWIMRMSKTSERVGAHAAYFHPRDTVKIVMDRFQELD